MNQIKMFKSKGWVINIEIKTIRRKIENEGRNKVNEGRIQESNNTMVNCDENVDIKHADSAKEEPIRIIENGLSHSKEEKEPFWKRSIRDISRLKNDRNKIEAWFTGR